MKKTLFIFGAGASKADGAPLQNELMAEIFKILKELLKNNNNLKTEYFLINNLSKNNEIVNNLKSLAKFLNNLYPFDRLKKRYPSFEEIMGLFYFAKIRDETFKETSQKQLNTYFEMIIALISIILDHKLSHFNVSRDNLINYRFIDSLYRKDKNSYKKDKDFHMKYSFLKINYDILLDNALFYLIDNNKLKQKIDYCFNKFPCKNENGIKLFKPHGSLN